MHKIVHVRPVDDAVGHEESVDCLCGPTGQGVHVAAADRSVGMIYHHHALRPCHEWEASAEA
ncbi:hypothetical protein [Streptosporangium sp. NPDC087985]|uniref:hypothetical protein n=1 Tax=Streptosporangium sp. NPDC087985 TaxID=3366196 RepID=UPI003826FDEB